MSRRERKSLGAKVLVLASILAALAVTGCGELTAGGFAHADVVVSGDAPEPSGASASETTATSPAPAGVTSADSSGASAGTGAEPVTGQVTATLELSVQAPDGQWVSLTPGLRQVTVDISGVNEETVAEAEPLDPGLYSRVRVRFTDVTAHVDSGLPGITGDVRVDLGDSTSVTAERPLQLDVKEGDSVQILVDLNSTQWLHAAVPALSTVAAVHLRNAVEVRVR